MWVLIIWSLSVGGIAPDSLLIAIDQRDCDRMQRIVNERIIALPNQTVGASCAFTELPRAPRS